MSPRPCKVMKLIISGVASSAAQTRSPSFSRSSSSATMMILPLRRSSIACSMVPNTVIVGPKNVNGEHLYRLLFTPLLQKSLDVLADRIRLEVNPIPHPPLAQGGVL